MMRTAMILALVSVLTVPPLTTIAAAEDTAPRDFGFRPLEIYAFRHGTSELTVEDVNGNGRDDIVFVNNNASRIEILMRKPDAASGAADATAALDDRFDNIGLLVDQQILFYALADLDGDGRKDLATFGPTLGLHVRMQTEQGVFGKPERFHLDRLQDVVGLRLADVSGNGLADIALCRRNGAEILLNDGTGLFPARQRVAVSEETCTGLEWLDITGDGRLDAVFFCQSQDAPVRLRTRDAAGGFNMEALLSLPPTRYAAPIPARDGVAPRLGGVLRNGLGFRLYEFERRPTPSLLDARDTAPRRLLLQGMDRRSPPAWVVADVDKDGYDDVIVAAPELSQIHIYPGQPDGLRGEPVAVDSLTGVQAIALTASGEILAVSRRENAAALHDPARFDVFPRILKLPGSVLTASVKSGSDHLFFICQDENRQLILAEQRTRDADVVTRELDLRDEPAEMTVMDLGADRAGLVLFLPHAPPAMFRVSADAVERVASSEFGALSLRLTRRNLLTLSRKEADAAVVAFGRTARLFEPDGPGYVARRQFNPGNEQAEVVAACAYPGSDGQAGTMIYDQNGRNLLWFAEGAPEPGAKIHVRNAPGDVVGMTVLRHPQRETLLLVARDSLNMVSGGSEQIALVPGPEYMSEAEKPSLQYFRPVAPGRPPRDLLALVDAANRSIEWIGLRDGAWRRSLAFEVFHDSGFGAMTGMHGGGMEPRAIASGDLDGNGAGDMVILVHDKLLIYPGE